MKIQKIQLGKYQHYKTKKSYEVLGVVRHSETHEEMVLYKALYDCDAFGSNVLWVRPKEMFFEMVLHHGEMVPRFEFVS